MSENLNQAEVPADNPFADYNPGEGETSNHDVCASQQEFTPMLVEGSAVAPKVDILKTFVDLDMQVSEIYEIESAVNESFRKVSAYFRRQADNISQGRNPEYLSEDEKKQAAMFEVLSFVSSAAGRIFTTIDSGAKIDAVKPRLHDLAVGKLSLCESQYAHIKEIDSNNRQDLLNLLNNGNDFGAAKTALKEYRNIHYHFILLDRFLLTQYRDWSNGVFSRTYDIPDMQDVNAELIYDLFGSTEGMIKHLNASLSGDSKNMKTRVVVSDSALLATLQVLYAKEKEIRNEFSDAYYDEVGDDGMLPIYMNKLLLTTLTADFYTISDDGEEVTEHNLNSNRRAYLQNKAVQANIKMARQLNKANSLSEAHATLVLVRNLLGSALVLLPCYVYMPLWLAIILTVIVLVFAYINASHIANGILKNANDKKKRICQYAITLSRRIAGDTPELKQIGSIIARRNATLWGALIGGVIGIIFGGIGLIPGAFIGAFIGSFVGGDEREDRMTDGEDWDQIDLSFSKKHFYGTIMTLVLLLVEIVLIFFTDVFD